MKKILVAYDRSECAKQAVDDLIYAGLPAKAEARVISVADVWLPPEMPAFEPAPPDAPSRSRADLRLRALEHLETSREIAEEGAAQVKEKFPGWKVEPIWKADSPGWAVLQESTRWAADLVVVGAHSHSTLHRFFLGSVSQKVVAEAHCSVRVARPHHREGRELRIVVAVDGSSDSENTIKEVAGRVWPKGSQFQVVTVVDPKIESYGAAHEEGGEWVTRMTERSAEKLRKSGLDTEVHIFDGDPKKRLLEQADGWKADCIFLGARGLNHGERLYLGTFASAVASRAQCSVEIVRAK